MNGFQFRYNVMEISVFFFFFEARVSIPLEFLNNVNR